MPCCERLRQVCMCRHQTVDPPCMQLRLYARHASCTRFTIKRFTSFDRRTAYAAKRAATRRHGRDQANALPGRTTRQMVCHLSLLHRIWSPPTFCSAFPAVDSDAVSVFAVFSCVMIHIHPTQQDGLVSDAPALWRKFLELVCSVAEDKVTIRPVVMCGLPCAEATHFRYWHKTQTPPVTVPTDGQPYSASTGVWAGKVITVLARHARRERCVRLSLQVQAFVQRWSAQRRGPAWLHTVATRLKVQRTSRTRWQ